jgi:hypothetical protein
MRARGVNARLARAFAVGNDIVVDDVTGFGDTRAGISNDGDDGDDDARVADERLFDMKPLIDNTADGRRRAWSQLICLSLTHVTVKQLSILAACAPRRLCYIDLSYSRVASNARFTPPMMATWRSAVSRVQCFKAASSRGKVAQVLFGFCFVFVCVSIVNVGRTCRLSSSQ